jgi:hypothetical protein
VATRRKSPDNVPERRGRPATTPEARENQLVNMAVDLAERQMREGTASSQVITHYLKLGSSREKIEQQLIRERIEVERAKVENMKMAGRLEELMGDALNAFKSYAGGSPMEIEGEVEE